MIFGVLGGSFIIAQNAFAAILLAAFLLTPVLMPMIFWFSIQGTRHISQTQLIVLWMTSAPALIFAIPVAFLTNVSGFINYFPHLSLVSVFVIVCSVCYFKDNSTKSIEVKWKGTPILVPYLILLIAYIVTWNWGSALFG